MDFFTEEQKSMFRAAVMGKGRDAYAVVYDNTWNYTPLCSSGGVISVRWLPDYTVRVVIDDVWGGECSIWDFEGPNRKEYRGKIPLNEALAMSGGSW